MIGYNISNENPVVIIGGGLAGLTAAVHLRRHGVPVRIYEAGKQIAGLARSEKDADGFTYDFGAHFITNRLAAAVGVSSVCRDMPRYGETVHVRGTDSSYPLGLMKRPRFMMSAAQTRTARLFHGNRPQNAAEWYRATYGAALADEVAIPLTMAWSGVSAEELAPSVGQKFATSLPRSLMLKLAGAMSRRTVAIGYSHTIAESPHVWHVYPEGGIGTVCHRLAEEVREDIFTEHPVEQIHVENNRVVGVRVAGKNIFTGAVISTAPVHILPRLIQGSDRLTYLSQFSYRAMVFVNLRFEGPSGLGDVVTWVPGDEFPFFRLSDIALGLPWLVPAGKSQVTADIGCSVGDEIWNADPDQLGKQCVAALEKIVPDMSLRYLGCRVMKTALAYPIFKNDYEERRISFERETGIGGLISIGRNGEFAHLLMEDVYWRTKRRVTELMAEIVRSDNK